MERLGRTLPRLIEEQGKKLTDDQQEQIVSL
jgi:hypothetical protein